MGHLTNHVVICNWNTQAQRVVETIHSELLAADESKWKPVVVVAEGVEAFPDSPRYEDTLLVPGSPLNTRLLRRANVQDAHTVIIVADRALASPDDQTLQIALSIRSILRSAERHVAHEPRVTAEVLDSKRAPNFRKRALTGIHEVVCETDLSVRVLAQTNLSPGLTYLLSDVLEFDRNENDIYMIPIPADWQYTGKRIHRFSELVRYVGQRTFDANGYRPALLLGLHRVSGNRDDLMLVNPPRSRLAEFGPLREGDALVLLARTPEHAENAIRSVASTESPEASERTARAAAS